MSVATTLLYSAIEISAIAQDTATSRSNTLPATPRMHQQPSKDRAVNAKTLNCEVSRQTHLAYLRSRHDVLKEALLASEQSQLINEAWYGALEHKCRILFVDTSAIPLVSRLEALNRFILDDHLPGGGRPTGARAILRPNSVFRNGHLRQHYIREVCASAKKIVENQYFQDGNHRTAVLTIYEKMADVDVLVTCAPMKLYVLLSNRKEQPELENSDALFRLVWNNHHKVPENRHVTSAQRARIALEVKNIQYHNTQVHNVYEELKSKDLRAGRMFLRRCKRTDPALYHSLRDLLDLGYWT